MKNVGVFCGERWSFVTCPCKDNFWHARAVRAASPPYLGPILYPLLCVQHTLCLQILREVEFKIFGSLLHDLAWKCLSFVRDPVQNSWNQPLSLLPSNQKFQSSPGRACRNYSFLSFCLPFLCLQDGLYWRAVGELIWLSIAEGETEEGWGGRRALIK